MKNLLFVHGWATDNRVWEGCIEALIGDNLIFNINLPGHGGGGSWGEPTFAPAVEELGKTFSTLENRSVVGVGWSLGAEALISALALYKDKFSGLVLVGASPCFVSREDFPYGQRLGVVKRMIKDMKSEPGETVKRFYEMNFTARELRTRGAKGFIERYRYPGPITCAEGTGTAPPGCFPAFRYDEITTALEALCKTDLRECLREIDIPALIVHGGLDAVCPVEAGKYLASNIKGARIEVFEKAGHAPFITERDGFVERVKGFIDKL